MKSTAATVNEYLDSLPEDRKKGLSELREVILKNLPKGYTETMAYGMPAYVVPHSIYPKGYHCDSKIPLPLVNIASQKNHLAFYHMGLYANKELYEWFTDEWKKRSSVKLDIGKSCIRFKKKEDIPFDLMGELIKKLTPEKWITLYESMIKR